MARKDIINGQSYNQGFYNANDNFIELYNNIADIFPFRGTIPANATIDSLKQGTYLEYGTKWNNRPQNSSLTNYAIITVTDTRGGSETYKHIKYLNSDSELFEKFGNASWLKVATDKQPNWITATLQNGWTGTLQYRKNQINQLEVKFDLVAGTITPYTLITTLPLQYSISHFVDIGGLSPDTGERSIFYYNSGSNSIYVSPDKSIVAGQKCAGSFVAPI